MAYFINLIKLLTSAFVKLHLLSPIIKFFCQEEVPVYCYSLMSNNGIILLQILFASNDVVGDW